MNGGNSNSFSESSHRTKSQQGRGRRDEGASNAFQNDGSFMEMFKRRMDEQKRKEDDEEKNKTEDQKVVFSHEG